MKRRLVSSVLVFILLLSLWGCAPASEAPESAAVPSQSPDAAPETAEPEEQSAFPVTLTDAAGREIRIESEPLSIVSGYYITTSMLIALGQAKKLTGIEAKADTRPIYSLAAPALLELPSVGTAKEFDLEGCAALEPDLIILPVSLKDSIPALEALGLTVLTVKPESLELLRETIEMLGAATGAGDAAEALLAYSLETESFLAELLAGVERPEVYFAGNNHYLSTAGAKMYQNTLIEMGGGINAAAGLEDDYWAEISYEQLLAWDPEVIIIAPGAKYTREDILADAELSSLKAVRQLRIFTMPSGLEAWDSPVPGAAVGSRWTASVLHPELYSFESFSADATVFYKSFYGIEVAPDLLTQ